MSIRAQQRSIRWMNNAQKGTVTILLVLLLGVVSLSCAAIIRSVVYAQAALVYQRQAACAQICLEGVVRIARAIYSEHAQEIRDALLNGSGALSLTLRTDLEQALTQDVPKSRIIVWIMPTNEQQVITARSQLVNPDDQVIYEFTTTLDTI